ncbi:MAG TPA: hypothetical protein VNS58_30725 [Puia sp.]|nr:hypothetical protein [Puia sp.]
MRTRYTILFFIGTLSLTGLSWLFLARIDKGSNAEVLLLILSGIVASIFLLVLLLRNYFK